MTKLHYEFKLIAFIKEKKGTITQVPTFGFLDLKYISVKGGIVRTFERGTKHSLETADILMLGGEMQDILRYKNLGMIRLADKYSNDFNTAFTKKKKLFTLVSFRGYRKSRAGYSKISSSLLTAQEAKITAFNPHFYKRERLETIKFKFRDPEISYKDPTATIENIMNLLKLGKDGTEKIIENLGI